MKDLEIYIHAENCREKKLVKIPADATIDDIIKKYHHDFNISETGEETVEVFIENKDSPHNKEHKADHCGIKHRHHIHCHRCHDVKTQVEYNGKTKHIKFPPSATGENVLKQSAEAFDINEIDAAKLVLELEDETVIESTDHLGSFVQFPHCSIKLFLRPNKQVQG